MLKAADYLDIKNLMDTCVDLIGASLKVRYFQTQNNSSTNIALANFFLSEHMQQCHLFLVTYGPWDSSDEPLLFEEIFKKMKSEYLLKKLFIIFFRTKIPSSCAPILELSTILRPKKRRKTRKSKSGAEMRTTKNLDLIFDLYPSPTHSIILAAAKTESTLSIHLCSTLSHLLCTLL